MKVVYFQSVGGASGDMILGALVDCGLPLQAIQEVLDSLALPRMELSAWRDRRGALSGTRVDVKLSQEASPATIEDFVRVIQGADLPLAPKEMAIAILRRLEEAEAAVHGGVGSRLCELGLLDTVADVLGAAMGLHFLGVEQIYSSPLMVGSGTVSTSHGILPVPAPATAYLIAESGAPVTLSFDDTLGELTTPTGAAILTTLASFNVPTLYVDRVGYGLGSREIADYPNALGAWCGRVDSFTEQPLVILETNIDDTTAEVLGYVQELLIKVGARDVWVIPIQMKKGRPGILMNILTTEALQGVMVDVLFRETSTLGIRVRRVDRYEVDREEYQVETSLGIIPVKVKMMDGQIVWVAPEFEVCRALADTSGKPLHEIYWIAEAAARSFLS